MKLKSKIKGLIDESGYKRSFIAEKLGVSVKQLRNYESGNSLIPMDKAFILVKLLQGNLNDLYEEDNRKEAEEFES